jgi:ABC-type transport system involved in multi-copper enzyme maturation permease subunit
MVGAVFHQEWLLGSRRSRLYLFRWVYAGWLVLLVLYGYGQFHYREQQRLKNQADSSSVSAHGASAPEVVGQWFAETFVAQQMLLLVLATPAVVAGAVSDEKRRGTLQYLLGAALESRHIVLGKLLGRVAQVALVAVAGLPLFALLAGFGGVEPVALLAVAAALVVPLFALAAAALLASVLCRQTRDAVLALYVVGVVAGLAVWHFRDTALDYFNPLYVVAPAWGGWKTLDLGEVGRRLLLASLGWGTLGGLCLAGAVWRLRPAYLAELENVRPRAVAWYSPIRGPVRDNPVHWRERCVEGLAPARALRRLPQWLGVSAVAAVTAGSSLTILALSLPAGTAPADLLRAVARLQPGRLAALLPDAAPAFLVQSLVAMLLASLVVGIRCSGTVTGERERQTWEALLLTPLSAREIIRGKLWGVMSASYGYLLAYAAPAVVLSVFGGLLALFWVLIWLAVTVLAMYYVGAAGLWCSVRARNSWRALLGTLAAGYAGGLAVYAMTSPVIAVAALIVGALLSFIDRLTGRPLAGATTPLSFLDTRAFFICSCLGLALIFFLMSRLFLAQALRWVADRERTRHWHEEPVYRRSRRRPEKETG